MDMDVVRTVSSSADTPNNDNGHSSSSNSETRLRFEEATTTSSNDEGPHHQRHALISADDTAGPTRIPAVEPVFFMEPTHAASSMPAAASAAAAVQDDEDEEDERHVCEDDEEDDDVEEEEDDDDEYEYEYEDEDDAAFGGFLQVDNPTALSSFTNTTNTSSKPAKIEEDVDPQQQPPSWSGAKESEDQDLEVVPAHPPAAATAEPAKKPQWKEPTREAVNMSLRAEKETSGSKRRLAQDLYRIMNKDTEETGFSLKPSSEDSMDKWTIKLFQFDDDSHLAKDMLVLGLDSIELEMSFPEQYPFEPPFVRVVQPRFKRQTGFVMNGAICMELLTKDGWNPVNDIESVIVSVRSLLVVGEGRLEAAYNLPENRYNALLEAAESLKREQGEFDSNDDEEDEDDTKKSTKRQRKNSHGESQALLSEQQRRVMRAEKNGGKYTEADAKAAYEHLSTYHKKKGWDTSGWWARKG